ncbi:hypothetical protein H4S01_004684 [Coemansia sp. RSA 2610]|nr:hypothetical protein H4S01_004684 [Coemansia sp. RSA 2610]
MSTSPKTTETPVAAEKVELPNKVFVGNLPFKTTDEELIELFEQFGPVAEARVIRRAGRSLGYGFVAFVEAAGAAAAEAAQLELDERTINVETARPMSETEPREAAPSARRRPRRARKAKEAKEASVGEEKPAAEKPAEEAKEGGRKRRTKAPAAARTGTPSETVAYVGNLPFATTDEELSSLFAGFSISSARIVTSKKTNRSKGYGFVTFSSNDDQSKAISKYSDAPLVVSERPLTIKAAMSETPMESTEASA